MQSVVALGDQSQFGQLLKWQRGAYCLAPLLGDKLWLVSCSSELRISKHTLEVIRWRDQKPITFQGELSISLINPTEEQPGTKLTALRFTGPNVDYSIQLWIGSIPGGLELQPVQYFQIPYAENCIHIGEARQQMTQFLDTFRAAKQKFNA